VHDVTRAINEAADWEEALRHVLQILCSSLGWQLGYVYLPDRDAPEFLVRATSYIADERVRPFHDAFEHARYRRGQSLPGRALAGEPIWMDDRDTLLQSLPMRGQAAGDAGLRAAAVLPITVGTETVAVIELFSAEPHPPSEQLMDVMDDLSAQIGRVIERERLMGQMADLVWREQQELLHTLHDSLGQTLTALGMLSSGLSKRLDGVDTDAADTARHVATLAQEALGQVRQLSKGVAPTEIEARGFSQALGQLATATSFVHGVDIEVGGELPESCPTRTTTHLYRIAQEAVTNAVKHARARTIRIEVHAGAGQASLSIVDDGVGMRAGATKPAGLGLHIMRHRARSIGGQLEIGAGPGGGTRITCTIRLRQLSEGS